MRLTPHLRDTLHWLFLARGGVATAASNAPPLSISLHRSRLGFGLQSSHDKTTLLNHIIPVRGALECKEPQWVSACGGRLKDYTRPDCELDNATLDGYACMQLHHLFKSLIFPWCMFRVCLTKVVTIG